MMTYGMDRDFARLLMDEEIAALPPPKPFPWALRAWTVRVLAGSAPAPTGPAHPGPTWTTNALDRVRVVFGRVRRGNSYPLMALIM